MDEHLKLLIGGLCFEDTLLISGWYYEKSPNLILVKVFISVVFIFRKPGWLPQGMII